MYDLRIYNSSIVDTIGQFYAVLLSFTQRKAESLIYGLDARICWLD